MLRVQWQPDSSALQAAPAGQHQDNEASDILQAENQDNGASDHIQAAKAINNNTNPASLPCISSTDLPEVLRQVQHQKPY